MLLFNEIRLKNSFGKMESKIKFKIAGKFIELEDNPEIIRRLRNDDQFTLEFFHKAFVEKRLENFGVKCDDNPENVEIIRIDETLDMSEEGEIESFYETPETDVTSDTGIVEQNNTDLLEETKLTENLIWTANCKSGPQDIEATELLISLRSSDKFRKRFDDRKTVKLTLWKEITDIIEATGYKLGANGAVRCRAKFSNLQHRYTQFVQHMRGTGKANLQKPPFFNEMHELLGNKAKVVPTFTVDSEGKVDNDKTVNMPSTSRANKGYNDMEPKVTANVNENQDEASSDSCDTDMQTNAIHVRPTSSSSSKENIPQSKQGTRKHKYSYTNIQNSKSRPPKNNSDRTVELINKCHEEDREERRNQFSVLKDLVERQNQQRDRLLDILKSQSHLSHNE